MTYRYMGHSLSDQRATYRTTEEEQPGGSSDPIDTYERQVLSRPAC